MSGKVPRIWRVADGIATTGDLGLTGVSIGGQFYDGGAVFSAVAGTDWDHAELPDFTVTNRCDYGEEVADLLTAGSRFGAALLAHDLDGDGLDELIVGAPGADAFNEPVGASPASSYLQTGAVVIYQGQTTGSELDEPLLPIDVITPYTMDAPGGAPLFNGSHDGAEFGAALAVADLAVVDGCPDLLVGAPKDFSSQPSASPPETAGDHTGSPSRSGRVFGFQNGLQDGDCLLPTLAEAQQTNINHECPMRFGAVWDFEERTQQAGAEYGASVTARDVDVGVPSLVVIGAPGFDDLTKQPTATDAGIVDAWRVSGTTWTVGVKTEDQRLSGDTHGTGSAEGNGSEKDDQYGFSVHLVGNDLAVGAPGEGLDRGAVFRFTDSAGSLTLPTSDVFLGVGIPSLPADGRLGHQVTWARWEGGNSTGPGLMVGAPHTEGTGASGRVECIRGTSTDAGNAFSLVGTDLQTVTP